MIVLSGTSVLEALNFSGEMTRTEPSGWHGALLIYRSAQCFFETAELLETAFLSCVGRESEAA